MSQDQERQPQSQNSYKSAPDTYYTLLRVSPSSTVQEIRQAYRELSKLYHPDTTQLSLVEAKQQFQRLNEAYATLSNPEKRLQYDLKAGFSRFSVVQPPSGLQTPKTATRQSFYSSSAYLDPNDRPLSPGEVFALVILGITFLLCLVLAVVLSFSHSEARFEFLRAVDGVAAKVMVADLKAKPQIVEPEPLKTPEISATAKHELQDASEPTSPPTVPWLTVFSDLLPASNMSQATAPATLDASSPEASQESNEPGADGVSFKK